MAHRLCAIFLHWDNAVHVQNWTWIFLSFIKHRKCFGALQYITFSSVSLCCYKGCRCHSLIYMEKWWQKWSCSSNTASLYSSHCFPVAELYIPFCVICRGVKLCCRDAYFERRACKDQWCQLVVDRKNGLFLSTLITPGVSCTEMLGLVIQKYSCPVAAEVRSRSKATEITEALRWSGYW